MDHFMQRCEWKPSTSVHTRLHPCPHETCFNSTRLGVFHYPLRTRAHRPTNIKHTRLHTSTLLLLSTRGYTSSVGVQHGNTHSHWIYKLRGSPAWKHTGAQEDNQALWGPALTLFRIYKLCGSPAWKHTITQDVEA